MAESNPLKLSHEQLRATRAAQSLRFVELFERQGVSLDLFSPRTADTQQPHDRDELYFVASGPGTFRRQDEVVAFETGDILFVADMCLVFSEDLSAALVDELEVTRSVQQESDCCIGGHLLVPYEQCTQQSPGSGLSTVLQCSHSYSHTQLPPDVRWRR